MEIAWPVFRLGLNKPIQEEGVVFYYHAVEQEEGPPVFSIRVIDDTTVKGETLSLRRLQLTLQEAPLFKVHNAIYFLGDLIKIATPSTWFIDSRGKVFTYTKSTRAKLKIHKIAKIMPINTGGAVIAVEGLPTRFKCLFTPSIEMEYVGILHSGLSLILYGFYEHYHEESWRKI